MTEVFVYGTLLKVMCRSEVMATGVFLGNASIRAILYDLGPFPAILEGDGTVYGELYDVPPDKLRELDWIEAYYQDDPARSLYISEEISVTLLSDGSDHSACAYFFKCAIEQGIRIECGDYRRYQLEVSSEAQWYVAYGSNMSLDRRHGESGNPHRRP